MTDMERWLMRTLEQLADAAIGVWCDEDSDDRRARLYRATDAALAVLDRVSIQGERSDV